METLYELWAKRNPRWEIRYQKTIIEVFTDYGKGTSQYLTVRGKTFGAGYEMLILAFFIGLYSNKTKPLCEDKSKVKTLGQAIMYWGNIETRAGRTAYPRIREYLFAALIARTDIDFIALDKGEIEAKTAVDALINKMEEYINYGLSFIQEKLDENPNCYFKEGAFLSVFQSFLNKEEDNVSLDEPEDL